MKDTDFNLAKNIKGTQSSKAKEAEIIIDEYDEEDDDDFEETPSSSNQPNLKDQMTKFAFVIIGGIVIIVLLIIIVLSLMNRSYTYEEIEQIMVNAAESYFKKNPESLPTGTSSIEIDCVTLSAAGEMKPLEEYLPEGSVCTGSVNVQSSNGVYLYTPKLNCGELYMTQELYRVVENNNKNTSNGYGLYNKAGNKVFRGEVVNNYVQLDFRVWRIVKITSSGEMVLITDEYPSYGLAWDDRYNQSVDYASGINSYATSRIKESINEFLKYPEDTEEAELFLSDKDKARIVPFNLCTGKRSKTEQGSDNAAECREVAKQQLVGLLTVSDYMSASTDTNCKSSLSAACQNYNYLVNGEEWWTATPVKENTYEAYSIDTDGEIKTKTVNNYSNLRPVIHLNSRTLYKSGDGSKENPYIVK